MALEGYLYREPVEADELRSLLVREIVAWIDLDDDHRKEAVDGLAKAYRALIKEAGREDEHRWLSDDDAAALFKRCWVGRVMNRIDSTTKESARSNYVGSEYWIDVVRDNLLPESVVRDAALAVADGAIALHNRLQDMKEDYDRRALDAK